jgi:phasin family protein
MTYLTPDQVAAATKANLETLFGLTNKAFEGVEKLVELNLQVAKATLAESAEHTKAALAVKDVQELLTLQAAMLQPSAEKAVAYSRHLYDIATGATSEFTKTAGSESAVALVKSAMTAANNAYESVHKAAKQAADMAEANFTAMGSTAVKASQAAAKSTKRAA